MIEKVTGVDLNAETGYAAQRQASERFRQGFENWRDQKSWRAWRDDFLTSQLGALQVLLADARQEGDEAAARGLQERIRDLRQEIRDETQKISRFERQLRDIRGATTRLTRTGFVSLSEGVVQAFQDEGFTWGGEWSGDFKDYMHFERP